MSRTIATLQFYSGLSKPGKRHISKPVYAPGFLGEMGYFLRAVASIWLCMSAATAFQRFQKSVTWRGKPEWASISWPHKVFSRLSALAIEANNFCHLNSMYMDRVAEAVCDVLTYPIESGQSLIEVFADSTSLESVVQNQMAKACEEGLLDVEITIRQLQAPDQLPTEASNTTHPPIWDTCILLLQAMSKKVNAGTDQWKEMRGRVELQLDSFVGFLEFIHINLMAADKQYEELVDMVIHACSNGNLLGGSVAFILCGVFTHRNLNDAVPLLKYFSAEAAFLSKNTIDGFQEALFNANIDITTQIVNIEQEAGLNHLYANNAQHVLRFLKESWQLLSIMNTYLEFPNLGDVFRRKIKPYLDDIMNNWSRLA